MQWDLNWTVGSVLAVSAILSPILTALINNRHLRKMRKIEMKQEEYKDTVVFKRKTIETYMQMTAGYVQSHKIENRIEYAQSFGLAIVYVPNEIRTQMLELDKNVNQKNYEKSYEMFTTLIPQLIAFLQTL